MEYRDVRALGQVVAELALGAIMLYEFLPTGELSVPAIIALVAILFNVSMRLLLQPTPD